MNSETLRAAQAPLKEHHRADPGSAVVTLGAPGELGAEAVTCSVQTGRALVEAGLHPATGGDGTAACSGDMLLHALVAFAGVTLRAIATSRGLNVRGAVHAEGDLDFRGTLGVDRGPPVGFRGSASASTMTPMLTPRTSPNCSRRPSVTAWCFRPSRNRHGCR